jgi:hypothetical protein
VSSDGADRGFVLELRQRNIHVPLMNEVRQLGEEAGGAWHGETHFLALGNQVNSMLSWLGS